MSSRPSRTRVKETIEGDVATIKGLLIAQVVIVIIVIAGVVIGVFYLYSYLSSALAAFRFDFGDITVPQIPG